ncbi:MAG: hypothetical protein GW855_10425 [Erythrobacter sp.]|nr:hypothetical protein [Erythrobacter sp.]NCQ62792.1 hypothetical protein [Alphaproteobacteria bacterium]
MSVEGADFCQQATIILVQAARQADCGCKLRPGDASQPVTVRRIVMRGDLIGSFEHDTGITAMMVNKR